MRFKKFIINEASFGNKNLEKAVKSLIKVLGNKVGFKFHPFGGKGNNFERYSKGGASGIGMIYVLDNGRLVRFNWENNKKSNTLSSIDVWNDMKTLEKPDFNLDIPKDYNIVQSIKMISDFIKKPSTSLSEMAAKGHYGDKRIADAEKYSIDIDDPKFASLVKKAKSLDKKSGKIKVSKGVKENSTKSEDVKKAKKLLKEKKVADPNIIFDDLEDLIKMVGSGVQKSLLITGMAGIGKCFCGETEMDVEFPL